MKKPSNNRLLRRADRVEARAVKKMDKAKSNWTKAEAIRKFDKTKEAQNMAGDRFGRNASDKANQLYSRASRQEKSAKRKLEKANYLKSASGAKFQLAKSSGKSVSASAKKMSSKKG